MHLELKYTPVIFYFIKVDLEHFLDNGSLDDVQLPDTSNQIYCLWVKYQVDMNL